jgi:hypothetical protein
MPKTLSELFNSTIVLTPPVTCLGKTFSSDDDRRAYFTEELRKRLADPEFRKIEGFPIGKDEDILALSDPPYYTACPNPPGLRNSLPNGKIKKKARKMKRPIIANLLPPM